MIDVSLGKSANHSISVLPLRMISSVDSSLLLNWSVLQPSRMHVNSGRSIYHSLSVVFTLNNNMRTTDKCTATKQNELQTGQVYSSHHSLRITLQFQGSISEIVTLSCLIFHFNHSQGRETLNLTHCIIREGIATNL